MHYLCLIYFAEHKLDEMPPEQFESFMGECDSCGFELKASGHMLAGAQLQKVETATTIRVRNDRLSTTDGPFAETKEQLGGFCLMEARDLNEAIQVASRMPPARIGSIEIRPLKKMVQPVPPGTCGTSSDW